MRSRAQHALVAAGLTAALASVAAVAVAQTPTQPQPSQPPPGRAVLSDRDDTSGPLDLARVALGLGSDRRLRADVTMHGEWDGTDLAARDGAPGTACVKIWTKRDPQDDPADYLVCVTQAPDDPEELVGRVLRERANGAPKTVAEAAVTRPTARTVFIRFGQTAIGKPAMLRFAGESVFRGSRCPPPLGCVDLAPGVNASGRLRLR